MSVVALACPHCRGEIPVSGESARCSGCGADYPLVDGVPVVLAEELSEQHLHQRDYFDAEFSGYDEYTVENWRLSYIEGIFMTLKVLEGGSPYLDVGVGGSGATVIEAARRRVPAVGCDLSVPGVLAARRFAEQEGAADWSAFVVSAAEALSVPGRIVRRSERCCSLGAPRRRSACGSRDRPSRQAGRSRLADGAARLPVHASAGLALLLAARQADRT
jgi:uncharacterized protein YbaR (Trm112 family)